MCRPPTASPTATRVFGAPVPRVRRVRVRRCLVNAHFLRTARFFINNHLIYYHLTGVLTSHQHRRRSTESAIKACVEILADFHYLLQLFQGFLPTGYVIRTAPTHVRLHLPNGLRMTYICYRPPIRRRSQSHQEQPTRSI